jgi:hypothetical protein
MDFGMSFSLSATWSQTRLRQGFGAASELVSSEHVQPDAAGGSAVDSMAASTAVAR